MLCWLLSNSLTSVILLLSHYYYYVQAFALAVLIAVVTPVRRVITNDQGLTGGPFSIVTFLILFVVSLLFLIVQSFAYQHVTLDVIVILLSYYFILLRFITIFGLHITFSLSTNEHAQNIGSLKCLEGKSLKSFDTGIMNKLGKLRCWAEKKRSYKLKSVYHIT